MGGELGGGVALAIGREGDGEGDLTKVGKRFVSKSF